MRIINTNQKYKEGYESNYNNLNGPNKGFSKYYYKFLQDKKLTNGEVRILIALDSLRNKEEDKECIIISINYLQMKTNLEESVVYRLLHRLEEKEYIKVKNKGEYKKIIIKFDIEEKEEWLKVYNKLNDYKHFTFSDILVYCYFLNLAKAKKSNIIDFKSSAIAQKIGVSNSTITNSINNLVNLGLFKKDKKSIIILKNLSGLQEEEKEWIDNIERIKKKSKIINTDFENMFNEFEEGYEDETGYEDEVEINLEDSFNFSISREKYSERYRIG